MKKIWILLVIALVILFVGFREGLEATSTIKAPPYDAAEKDRIFAMVAQGPKNAFVQMFSQGTTRDGNGNIIAPESQAKDGVAGIIGTFYNQKYKTATSQITQADIDTFVTSSGGPPPMQNVARAALAAYFLNQPASGEPTAYQNVLTGMGQSTGPAPTPTGGSVLARKRPGIGDDKLRGEVSAYTGLPRDNAMINTIINEMGRFYDQVYVPNEKRMPTQSEIQTFVMSSAAVPANRKSNLTSAIDYWFTEPAVDSDFRLEGSPSTPPQVPGTTIDGGSSASRGFGAGIADNQVWGPAFAGFGRLRGSGENGDGSGRYPTLMGPPRERAPYMVGVGVLPPGPSSTPGDQDLIPDPYRVSQSYSPASNSSKNEPVPFLTDFSAFLK